MVLKKLLRKVTGRKYLLNKHTGQIHREEFTTVNCSLDLIADRNKKWLTKKQALKLIKSGEADGCRWCWKCKNNFSKKISEWKEESQTLQGTLAQN